MSSPQDKSRKGKKDEDKSLEKERRRSVSRGRDKDISLKQERRKVSKGRGEKLPNSERFKEERKRSDSRDDSVTRTVRPYNGNGRRDQRDDEDKRSGYPLTRKNHILDYPAELEQPPEQLPLEFSGFRCGEKTQIRAPLGKLQGRWIKFHVYRPYTRSGTSDPQEETVYKTLFVKFGRNPKSTLTCGTYAKYEDVIGRAFGLASSDDSSKHIYETDGKRWGANQAPFAMWGEDGKLLALSANTQPFTKLFPSSERRPIITTKRYDADPRVKQVLDPEQTSSERNEMINLYRNFFDVALHQCCLFGEGWDVISRFFDNTAQTPFKFYLEVKVGSKAPKEFKGEIAIKKAWDDAQRSCKFKPILGGILTLVDDPSSKGFQLVGTHPGKLYALWIHNEQAEDFHKLISNVSLPYPGQAAAEYMEGRLKRPNQIEEENDHKPVEAIVTAGSMADAATAKRDPTQKTVMNGVSANVLARTFWGKAPQQEAEWLHRCAFSFGGILEHEKAKESGSPNSAQVKRNMIFGTYETNTAMIRYESFIKRLVANTHGSRVRVTTEIAYSEDMDHSWMQEPKYMYTWFAPKLDYRYELISASVDRKWFKSHEKRFFPFSKAQTTRFEYELDLQLEDLYGAWDSPEQKFDSNL